MTDTVDYQLLEPRHFAGVLELGNRIHGDNYLSIPTIEQLYKEGFRDGINASLVALKGDQVVGFRLTKAHGNWPIDQWCTPEQWGVAPDKVCYFKCNTVDSDCQGQGIGSKLLSMSIEQAKQQGAIAGLAHIWLASPGNSAFNYFTANGGELIRKHPNKWREAAIYDGYDCPVCEELCSCEAAEMLKRFD